MACKAAIAIADADARDQIRTILKSSERWVIAFETGGGAGLFSRLASEQPHLAFIGFDLADVDPLEITRNVPGIGVALIDHDEHQACRAFEAGAIDYIVKPFDPARIDKTLTRVYRIAEAITKNSDDPGPCSKIVVWDNSHGRFLDAESVEWIEAVGNYVKIHANGESYYVRENIGSLDQRLDPDQFVRIHRSTIVNIERIDELVPASHGDLIVRLLSGRQLKMSRHFRKQIDQVIGKV